MLEEHDATIALGLCEALGKWDASCVNEDVIADFLFQQGLALEYADAQQLYDRFDKKGLFSSGANPTENEFPGKSDASSLQKLRDETLLKFKGMHQHVSEETTGGYHLVAGDSFTLFCNGLWATRDIRSMAAVERNMRATTGLVLREKHPEAFHIVAAERRIMKQEENETEDDHVFENVNYGDLVWIQNTTGKTFQICFTSPGKSGPVQVGDRCFIVGFVENFSKKSKRPSWIIGPGAHGPALVLGNQTLPACFTIRSPDGAGPAKREVMLPEIPSPSVTGEVKIEVLTFDVNLRPRATTPLANMQKNARSNQIPDALEEVLGQHRNVDVIILTGLQDEKLGPRLKAGLRRHFNIAFETNVQGRGQSMHDLTPWNGGITILSKFSILSTSSFTFGRKNVAKETSANRGVVYAKIEKEGALLHVFATHMQGSLSSNAKRARAIQASMIRDFIVRMKISRNEVVLIAGNINCCRVQSPDEYNRLLDTLGAFDCADFEETFLEAAQDGFDRLVAPRRRSRFMSFRSKTSMIALPAQQEDDENFDEAQLAKLFTFNPKNNILAQNRSNSDGKPGIFDYVLYSRNHGAPQVVSFEVLNEIKASKPFSYKSSKNVQDLSDHYPIYTKLLLNRSRY